MRETSTGPWHCHGMKVILGQGTMHITAPLLKSPFITSIEITTHLNCKWSLNFDCPFMT